MQSSASTTKQTNFQDQFKLAGNKVDRPTNAVFYHQKIPFIKRRWPKAMQIFFVRTQTQSILVLWSESTCISGSIIGNLGYLACTRRSSILVRPAWDQVDIGLYNSPTAGSVVAASHWWYLKFWRRIFTILSAKEDKKSDFSKGSTSRLSGMHPAKKNDNRLKCVRWHFETATKADVFICSLRMKNKDKMCGELFVCDTSLELAYKIILTSALLEPFRKFLLETINQRNKRQN